MFGRGFGEENFVPEQLDEIRTKKIREYEEIGFRCDVISGGGGWGVVEWGGVELYYRVGFVSLFRASWRGPP